MINCANCFNAKVKMEFVQSTGRAVHGVRCKYNHWTKTPHDWGFNPVYLIHDVHPPVKHTCHDYQSMGDEEAAFLESLPQTKDEYKDWMK